MTVYVDWLADRGWRYGPNCHMTADSLEELHAIAARLGLQRRYAQLPPTHWMPHYDLNGSKRALAVRYGAREIDRASFRAHMAHLRAIYLHPKGGDAA